MSRPTPTQRAMHRKVDKHSILIYEIFFILILGLARFDRMLDDIRKKGSTLMYEKLSNSGTMAFSCGCDTLTFFCLT